MDVEYIGVGYVDRANDREGSDDRDDVRGDSYGGLNPQSRRSQALVAADYFDYSVSNGLLQYPAW